MSERQHGDPNGSFPEASFPRRTIMNNRKLLLISAFLLTVAAFGTLSSITMVSEARYSEHGGLKWRTSLDGALQTASDSRPVLLYVYAENCGACADLDARLRRNDSPPALKERFVLAAVRADKQPEILERYNVSSTPTWVVLTQNGTKVTSFNPLSVTDLDARLDRAFNRTTSDT
ncbi:MAG: thiol:disulfide interchange protein [Halobacteriales archaeon]|jgi:thiol:disulfide interchange protein